MKLSSNLDPKVKRYISKTIKGGAWGEIVAITKDICKNCPKNADENFSPANYFNQCEDCPLHGIGYQAALLEFLKKADRKTQEKG